MPEVRGIDLDAATRCAHWHSPLDIIAIRMKCCGIYYACKDCHAALADHTASVWPVEEFGQKAILCGACGIEITINAYLASGYSCPACRALFNPNCRRHYHYYFAKEPEPPAEQACKHPANH